MVRSASPRPLARLAMALAALLPVAGCAAPSGPPAAASGAPGGVRPGVRPMGMIGDPGAYAGFASHALAAATLRAAERRSALLAFPGRLEPQRIACGESPPAVLIDLDPAGGLAPLGEAAAPAAGLAAALPALRTAGLSVVWITDRPAGDAATLRRQLRATGLDPTGSDPLLVMRYPGEPKQRRRRALGEAFCLVAIAGDQPADFDELYEYLRDPSLAWPLERLFGDGWFVVPDPLTPAA